MNITTAPPASSKYLRETQFQHYSASSIAYAAPRVKARPSSYEERARARDKKASELTSSASDFALAKKPRAVAFVPAKK